MCGICGAVSDDPRRIPLNERVLVRMRDSLVHRGPDDAGLHLAPGGALGSRRLSILDLSERGHMPMPSDDGRYWITYNGEVYNYRALRADLEARGHCFHSNTDTEVVLKAYIADGPAMLERLNGMFAIAIWDAQERVLFLARDRLGIKPLYYARHEGVFYFASEPKALFAAGVPADFDPTVWEELLCFRFVAGQRTVFHRVERLLPGHWMRLQEGRIEVRRWWRLDERASALRDEPLAKPERWFQRTFDEAVDLRRISDVPIGVMLSGGLDSSSVAASLALQAGSGVEAFTVAFTEPGYDESEIARTLIERWRLRGHEVRVDPAELVARVYRASWLNDEPLCHANDAHMLALSELAKPLVTVLLSGEGADETLNGYVRYQPLRFPHALAVGRWVLPVLRARTLSVHRVRKLARQLALGSDTAMVLYNACDVLPDELAMLGLHARAEFPYRQEVIAEACHAYPSEPLRQVMYSDQHTFLCSLLDRNDRMTMGASIECRVPFLDYRLVERAAALPTTDLLRGGQRKALLRRALGDRLPAAVRHHKKWGFGVPWSRYLREQPALRELVQSLPTAEPIVSGPFERARLHEVVACFLAGDSHVDALVLELAMVALWHQALVTNLAEMRRVAA